MGVLNGWVAPRDWGEIDEKKGLNSATFGYSRVGFAMRNLFVMPENRGIGESLGLARVLLVHGQLAPRLALQTILQAGGYTVDVAASPAEAMLKLDEGRYALVLTDNRFGPDVQAYARVKEYKPATAVVTSFEPFLECITERPEISVYTEDVPELLEHVAELIGARARRRYRPLLRHGG